MRRFLEGPYGADRGRRRARRLFTILTVGWAVLGIAALRVLTTTTWYVECHLNGIRADGTDCLGSPQKTHDGFPGSIGWDRLTTILEVAVLWVLIYLGLRLRARHRRRSAPPAGST